MTFSDFIKTIRHTPARRLLYYLWHSFKLLLVRNCSFLFAKKLVSHVHFVQKPLINATSGIYLGNRCFRILNVDKHFEQEIDWNNNDHGELWKLKLQSLDYLIQPTLSRDDGLQLVKNFIQERNKKVIPFHPYASSVSIINIIDFVNMHRIEDAFIVEHIQGESQFIHACPEYHLENNHLLENAFALTLAGSFCSLEKIYDSGKSLLLHQLNNQILSDGAHFERSVMYHTIVLKRLFDLLPHILLKNDISFERAIKEYIAKMISWLKFISTSSGQVPHFNDSAADEMPDLPKLWQLQKHYQIADIDCTPGESGYRKFTGKNYELIVDTAGLEPSANPGHAHADTGHFVLYYKDIPIMLETGITTYGDSLQRSYERSTKAHNSVSQHDKSQSELFGSFRTGKRVQSALEFNSDEKLVLKWKGYNSKSYVKRTFEFRQERICITDEIQPPVRSLATFIVDKNTRPYLDNYNYSNMFASIMFSFMHSVTHLNTTVSAGFNKFEDAIRIEIEFDQLLKTEIRFID